MKILFSIFFFIISIHLFAQKSYQKNYFDNGVIKSEGWIKNNQKNGYWKFYYENGNVEKEGRYSTNKPIKYWYFYTQNGFKKSEGHFTKGNKANWWLFYDNKGNVSYKMQLKDNIKNYYL